MPEGHLDGICGATCRMSKIQLTQAVDKMHLLLHRLWNNWNMSYKKDLVLNKNPLGYSGFLSQELKKHSYVKTLGNIAAIK